MSAYDIEKQSIELDSNYAICWKKQIESDGFEFYEGREDGGSLRFTLMEERNGEYLLETTLELPFGNQDEMVVLLSDMTTAISLQEGFDIAEKINNRFSVLYEKSE